MSKTREREDFERRIAEGESWSDARQKSYEERVRKFKEIKKRVFEDLRDHGAAGLFALGDRIGLDVKTLRRVLPELKGVMQIRGPRGRTKLWTLRVWSLEEQRLARQGLPVPAHADCEYRE